ncbi:MAG: hypothetical protein KBD29_01090 [Candidatus Magasanikbacteria bacterium]|nr:hypothetical protein [Candidatus Magasanikbacteria bacterium]
MKLTFPPAKFQIKMTLSGFLFAVFLIFALLSNIPYVRNVSSFFLSFFEDLIFKISLIIFPGTTDDFGLLLLITGFLITYSVIFLLIGNILWMVHNHFKNKAQT